MNVKKKKVDSIADSKSSTLDRKESDKRLEALEKSLQAASASIIATQPWQQQESKTERSEEVRRFETRSFETKQEQFHQEAVSRMESNGYPRSMSPVWDNIPMHVSDLTFCVY